MAKELWKSVKNYRSYGQVYSVLFFGLTGYLDLTAAYCSSLQPVGVRSATLRPFYDLHHGLRSCPRSSNGRSAIELQSNVSRTADDYSAVQLYVIPLPEPAAVCAWHSYTVLRGRATVFWPCDLDPLSTEPQPPHTRGWLRLNVAAVGRRPAAINHRRSPRRPGELARTRQTAASKILDVGFDGWPPHRSLSLSLLSLTLSYLLFNGPNAHDSRTADQLTGRTTASVVCDGDCHPACHYEWRQPPQISNCNCNCSCNCEASFISSFRTQTAGRRIARRKSNSRLQGRDAYRKVGRRRPRITRYSLRYAILRDFDQFILICEDVRTLSYTLMQIFRHASSGRYPFLSRFIQYTTPPATVNEQAGKSDDRRQHLRLHDCIYIYRCW